MSLIGHRVLWSNHPGEVLKDGIIPCFPLLDSTGYHLDPSEVRFLMTDLSPLFSRIADDLARAISSITGIDREPCQIILRESVVLITYALADRTLRLAKILAAEGSEGVGVAVQESTAWPKNNGQLVGFVDGSQDFNQYLIYHLSSSIWKIPGMKIERKIMEDVRNQRKINNLNFDHPGLLKRIRRKFSRMISARLGKFPALRLANIDGPLLDGGLYGYGKLVWLNGLDISVSAQRDLPLRGQLAQQITADILDALGNDVFLRIGIIEHSAQVRAAEVFSHLLMELIPSERLEGMVRYAEYEKKLQSMSAPFLFFCAMPSEQDIFWIAAAKKLHIPVIGVQHGVHYGFSNQPCFVDTEFAYCDRFVTWGWKEFPSHPLSSKIKAIALPSPWLSERLTLWKKIPALKKEGRGKRPHDVLLMSDRIQPFPPTVSTLRMSRLDFLGKLNTATYEIVSGLARRNIRVLNKPFNYTSRDMQRGVLDDLLFEFPEYYAEYEKLDKGLTKNLLESSWLVLWDEPGTGFFECLLGGIPSMLYWERLTSHEESHARPLFRRLEDVGLLHNSPSTLVEEVQRFLNDPEEWLSDTERCSVIREVTDRFSKTDGEWCKSWKAMLRDMKNEVRTT